MSHPAVSIDDADACIMSNHYTQLDESQIYQGTEDAGGDGSVLQSVNSLNICGL